MQFLYVSNKPLKQKHYIKICDIKNSVGRRHFTVGLLHFKYINYRNKVTISKLLE